MKLFLAVPRQSTHSSSEAATSAARTRDWAARLPLLNTRESLLQIRSSLHTINRAPMRVSQRLKLLDIHRSPLRVVQGQVESEFWKGAAPLSQNNLVVAGAFRDCCVEMAFGYKLVILEVARSRKRRQLDEMKLSMARALFYLEQTVFACALFRQSPPEGIWQEMHTIYNYARMLGVAEDPLKDPISKVRTSTTISVTYRRVLLFGLSDPFHQSVPLMKRMLDFLRRHADAAQIKRHLRVTKGYCQFIIDPMSDHPGRPFSKDDKQEPPKNALYLDTVNLTRDARKIHERMQAAEEIDVELDNEFQDELGRRLLEEIVHKWGLTTTRNEERSQAEQAEIEVMIGLDAVNYCVNDESPFELSALDHVGKSVRPSTEQSLQLHPSRLAKVTCHVLDRAESGFGLAVDYDSAPAGGLQVGDVVAYRLGDQSWMPALIRWMRCVEDTIQFGIRKLPGKARPIAVKRVSTERGDAFKPGLILMSEASGASMLQVVTPVGLYRHQRNLYVDDGNALLMIRTRKLIEASQMMEWFECETLNL